MPIFERGRPRGGAAVSRRRGGGVAVLLAATGSLAAVGDASTASAATSQSQPAAATGCHLASPTGQVDHIVNLVFDNVHFTRDNPHVPSDLEQMPHLLHFLESNGTLLSNEHTPLIAHTADDILTTLTGVYGDKHGQPVSNSYRAFNSDGTSSPASSFAYWTDPVAASHTTDTSPTMVTPSGRIAPAPWVPFTRAGCDVGAVATANMEIENPSTDIPNIFAPSSPAAQQLANDHTRYKDPEVADFEGIAVHCAKTGTSVCAGDANATADRLPDEPGGYQGYQALFGNKYVAPVVGGSGPGNQTVEATDGQPIDNPYTHTPGFPGFDISAAQTLGYVAAMQEHGVAITYGYIEDAHANHQTDRAAGPGDPAYVANLKSDDQAFATFFADLAAHGITPANTELVVSSDEGDHFAGTQHPSPAGCDGVTQACSYAPGQIGEVDVNLAGLLARQTGDTTGDWAIHADTAPNIYVDGDPGPGAPRPRQLEHEMASLSVPDPYANQDQRATVPLTSFMADQVEEKLLHMGTGDPNRLPTFTDFANPDLYVEQGGTTCSGPRPGSGQTATSDPCVVVDPSYAWNHGDVAPDIDTNWVAFAGPGVANRGVDPTTWADETDVRPTLMALVGLDDDYAHAGRVLVEDLQAAALPPAMRAHHQTILRLAAVYKRLDADVGQFGLDTLRASTSALESTSPRDRTYQALEQRLVDLGGQRDMLAGQMSAALEAAAFAGQPLDERMANQMIGKGTALLAQAHDLAG